MKVDRTTQPQPTKEQIDRWTADFERSCRARGIRVTHQRTAIYRILIEDPSHPGADRIHARLRESLPSVSLATVYRVLESLEKERLIRRVSTTYSTGRYDANLEPHQHLVCRVCGGIQDVLVASLAATDPPRLEDQDFSVEGLDIRILGICGGCRRAGERPARPA